ncbi:unnamed protein product [marine sediment metagenome]|uniref:Uncharacterized protein n=1 Tax=marine sediment metagenome TaxID=412755 RepID=X1SDJ8_9ZZZZ
MLMRPVDHKFVAAVRIVNNYEVVMQMVNVLLAYFTGHSLMH